MKSLIALFAAVALAGTAVAGDKKDKEHGHSAKDMTMKFEALDTNKDAQLSKAEAAKDQTISAQFASIDQDSDGFVSKSEFTAQLDPSERSSSDRSSDSDWGDRTSDEARR